jgi:hypothetical protein
MKITIIILLQIMLQALCEYMTFGLHKGEYPAPVNRMRLLETSPLFGNTSSLNYFYVNAYFGTPAKRQSLIIDTGSLITAVPCKTICEQCGTHLNSYYDYTSKLSVTVESKSSKLLTCSANCDSYYNSECEANKCSFLIVNYYLP